MNKLNAIILVIILLLIPYINIFCEENPFTSSGKPVFYSSTSIVPFELIGHKIFVNVKINDLPKNYRFLFDTGAFTCISDRLATKLDLKKEAALLVEGEIKNAHILRDPIYLSLNSIGVKNFKLISMDLNYFKTDDLPMDGFLGSNFLKYFNIQINYSKSEITFSRRPILPSSSKSFHFVLNTDNMMNLPLIKTRINRYLIENGLIDTGSPFPILFPINLIKKQTYSDTKDIIESEGVIVSWPWTPIKKNYITRIDQIEISSLELKNLPVIYSNTDNIIIGEDLLSQFITILNYSQKDGYFIPYKKIKFTNNIFTTGLSLKKSNGKTIVQAYWKGSIADKAGLKLHDEILELNAISTSQLSMSEINNILNNNRVSRITIVKREGNFKRRIELEKTLLFPEL